MPHIHVKMYPGRSEELKMAMSRAIVEAAANTLGVRKGAFSVCVEDVEKDKWNEEVVEKCLQAKKETVFITPDNM